MEFDDRELTIVGATLGAPFLTTLDQLEQATTGLEGRKLVQFLGNRMFESNGVRFYLAPDGQMFTRVVDNTVVDCTRFDLQEDVQYTGLAPVDALKILDAAAGHESTRYTYEICIGVQTPADAPHLPKERYSS